MPRAVREESKRYRDNKWGNCSRIIKTQKESSNFTSMGTPSAGTHIAEDLKLTSMNEKKDLLPAFLSLGSLTQNDCCQLYPLTCEFQNFNLFKLY